MNLTLQKALTFVLFIVIGLLLKLKFKSKEELTGIKKIILNLALPATIFIALIGVKIDSALLSLPFLALALNIILYLGFPYLIPLTGIKKTSPEYRTARLLVPSLAPGLSCFPFVLEFLGEGYLAKAAMADLGNKVFVLIFLYLIAMNWFYSQNNVTVNKKGSKLKSLILAMISEPVNIFIVIALILVFFGFNMETLPFFISEMMSRLGGIMTPLVLLYIGLAVHIKKKQLFKLLSLLLLRVGFVSILTGLFILSTNLKAENDMLLLFVFAMSACSFWPFSHIAIVDGQEKNIAKKHRTFNAKFAVNILALSFPISTILILGVLSCGSHFANAYIILIFGSAFLLIGLIPVILKKIISTRKKSEKQKTEWVVYRTTRT
ncbi:permease [Maribacter sp. CXY002]|uniref:permease n=1 Tax=Maribacter luteocoastalis TaxID=3407671 RepID=UPI003B67CFB6